MTTSPAITLKDESANRSVWERIWRNDTPATKDDAVLSRERNGARWAFAREFIASRFGSLQGLRCIELGAGRGDFSALLADGGAEVTLVDFSDGALEQARSRFDRLKLPGRFVKADIFEVGNDLAGRFDIAVSLGVIEHFRGARRSEVIAAHADVLRPGGMAVLSVPNTHCPPYRLWKLVLELRGWWPYGMEIPYSRRELARRSKEAGLAVAGSHCCGFWRSAGDHVVKGLLRASCGEWDCSSVWDRRFGSMLTLYAEKPLTRGVTD
jgi:2-polyprenyl-3-methyl-5-hydroxy-6-metoxy-1,4-benzoquinol methylase